MRTHNFAAKLANALAKPATEAVVTDPVPADAVAVPEVVAPAVEAVVEPVAEPAVAVEAAPAEPVATTEDLTPNEVEVTPVDPESPIEPNQVPAAGATAEVADPLPPKDVLEQPDHQDGTGEISTEAAVVAEPVVPAAEAVVAAVEAAPATPAEPATAPAPAEAAPAAESVDAEAVIAAPGAGTETVKVDEVPQGVENSLIACHDVCDQLDDNIDEAEGLHDATAVLESVLNAIHGEPNGIDGTNAKFVGMAIESVTSKWGVDVSIVPSVESFGGTISRQEATMTLESNVKEIIKQVIEYLKALWAKFVLLLKKFYQHLTEGTGFLERKAHVILAKAQHIEGAPSQANLVIDGSLAHRLAVNGEVPPLIDTIALADKIISGDMEESEENAKATAEAGAATVALFTADESNFDERLKAFEAAMDKAGTVSGGLFTEDGGKRTFQFPGGVSYEIKVGETISFNKHHHEGEVKSADKPCPTKENIVAYATKVIASAKQIHRGITAINEDEKRAHAVFDSMKDNANISEHQAKQLASTVTRFKITTSNKIRFLADVLIDLVKAESAGLIVCEKALALYGHAPGVVEKAAPHVSAAVDAVKEGVEKAKAVASEVAGDAGQAVKEGAAKVATAVAGGNA